MKPKKSSIPQIENSQQFRQVLLSSLSKLGDTSTQKTAFDELRELLKDQDPERISITISCLSESNDREKPSAKKENIKVIGLMSEVLGGNLVEYLPRIISLVSKRLQENDNQINSVCADTIGAVVTNSLRDQAIDQTNKNLSNLLRSFFGMFSGKSKLAQIGAAMCISKIIQMSPADSLNYIIDDVMLKLVELLKWSACKAQLQIFEAALSLLLAVEENKEKITKNGAVILPVVEDHLENPDWTVRKIAIETIYSLGVLAPEVLQPKKKQLIETLDTLKSDKVKGVREIAVTASNILKDSKGEPSEDKIPGDKRYHNNPYPQTRVAKSDAEDRGNRAVKKEKVVEPQKQPNKRSRGPLQVNEEFFRKAVRDGEIEIRVRSPPKGFNYEAYQDSLERSAERVKRENQDTGQTESPATKLRTNKSSPKKPNQREHSDPRAIRHESLRGEDAREALYNIPAQKKSTEVTNEEEDIYSNQSRIRSPQKNEELALHYDRTYVPRSLRKEEAASHRNETTRDAQKKQKEQKLSSGKKKKNEPLQTEKDLYQADITEIFRQLRNITSQQSKIMESINNFQRVTQDDIAQLQDRMLQMEESLENIQKDMSGGQFNQYGPSQPFDGRYGFVPQGQPIYYAPASGMIPGYYPFAHQPVPVQRTLSDSTIKQASGKIAEDSSTNVAPQKNKEEKTSLIQGSNKSISGEPKNSTNAQTKEKGGFSQQPNSKQSDNEKIPRRLEPTLLEEGDSSESPLRAKAREEHEKSGISDKQNISLNQTITWERIENFLAASLINDAYDACLKDGNSAMLSRLITKTGPVPEQLETQTLELLATTAGGEFSNSQDVISFVPFVDKALEDRIKLSSNIYKGLKSNFSKVLGMRKSLPEIDSSIFKVIENDLNIINSKLNE